MTFDGTALYAQLDEATMPPLVARAVASARELGFGLCVHPGTGRLLQVLAGGVPAGGLVGETGTGTGAGLAWMVSLASPDVTFLSVEIDPERAAAATDVFVDYPNVTIIEGDAALLFERGPFDLLVHDGGWGAGKSGPTVVLSDVVKEGGLMTVDDYTPMQNWPPLFEGVLDESRQHWLDHPDLLATEIRVAESMAVIVGRRTTR